MQGLEPESKVTIIDRDRFVSYGGCGIPFYVSGDVSDVNDLFRYRLLGGAIVAGFALCYLGLAGLFRLPEFDRMFVTALRRSRS